MKTPVSSTSRFETKKDAAACLAILAFVLSAGSALASDTFPPRTNVRLTIVQWVPAKSSYEKWDAVGGEFTISDDRTLELPIIGSVPVADTDGPGLAARISDQMKTKMGLVDLPEVTIAVVDYPPIYIVGDVTTPGEYKYRQGLSVLQALALSGGVYRSEEKSKTDHTNLVGVLRGLENSIIRGEIRTARLQAEMSGVEKFSYDLKASPHPADAGPILSQEQQIFEARANLLERQAKSYAEQRDILSTEIASLEKKAISVDQDIDSIEKELQNVRRMVDKGIALPGRQADMERMLRSYQANRLDLVTATMRARQAVAEASRNLDEIRDRQRAEVVTELQAEQANLDQLRVKRETTQAELLEALDPGANTAAASGPAALQFTVERRIEGKIVQLNAAEDTFLEPGDVVRVARRLPQENSTSGKEAALSRTTARSSSGLSQ